ncbi:MAG: CinA family nicotinamide mononucleotide deamidase-related protein [Phycisphaerales bacterium]
MHTAAAILSTGDELVLGQTLDTNARLIAGRLVDLGIVPSEHVTVGDDLPTLVRVLRRLVDASPLVIMTGGLGPTDGDLSRAALAELCGQPLVEDPDSVLAIRRRLESRGREATARQLRQAQRPALAMCLPNAHGTAPGLFLRVPSTLGTTDVYALPGPPGELGPMLERDVLPRLQPPGGRVVLTRLLHTIGLAEAEAADRLGGLTDRTRVPLVGITASGAVLTIRVRYEGPGPRETALEQIATTERLIRDALGPHVFGADADTLAGVVIAQAIAARCTIATVESCTGGLLGAMLTETPGSSAAMVGGWVTYSNALKTSQVGVPPEDLRRHGAVSEPVARAMARGGLTASGAMLCVSITGTAGPDGGTPEKPVGTVWIGLAGSGTEIRARCFRFPGSREEVRLRAARTALGLLYFALKGIEPGVFLWQVQPVPPVPPMPARPPRG